LHKLNVQQNTYIIKQDVDVDVDDGDDDVDVYVVDVVDTDVDVVDVVVDPQQHLYNLKYILLKKKIL